MKFIALVLFLIVCVTSVLSLDVYYVNFVPYANDECNSSTPYGLGFSFTANRCLQELYAYGTETVSNVFFFQVNTQFEVTVLESPPSPTCQQLDNPISTKYTNGSCIVLPKFTTFDGTYPGLENFQYAQVIITESQPIYYQNQVYVRFFRDGYCDNFPVYTISITDSIIVSYATRDTAYSCVNGNVYANNCTIPYNNCDYELLPEGTCFTYNRNNYEQIYCPPK